MRLRFIVLAAVLLASALPARSQTLDDQERCAAQARKAFQEWESDNKKGPVANLFQTLSSDYESHYNTKIKKCLMLIESTSTMASGNGNITTSAMLVDAYERHLYASYIWITSPPKKYWEVPPTECELIPASQKKKICTSRDEFDAFVAGYLEK
jgi:hypothetical protein